MTLLLLSVGLRYIIAPIGVLFIILFCTLYLLNGGPFRKKY